LSDTKLLLWAETALNDNLESISGAPEALPMENLSRLFQDAVLITRTLAYSYLWIDPLCIIQDSQEY